MAWIEPVSTVVTAASLANELAKNASTIKTYCKRIVTKLTSGSAIVPIFGAGGVGKSTAGKKIVGNDPLDVGAPYDESWTIEPQDLKGNIPGQVLIAPGQPARAERYWPDLISEANRGTSCGLVNVVCYGLHSFGIDSFTEHDLYQDGMSAEDFMIAYSAKRREDELTMLDRLLTALAPARREFFFLTLVTKQDLWWHEKQRVKDYYAKGLYDKKICAFGAKVGEQRFHHEYVPTSLTVANLHSPSGELMQATAQGYDHAIHLRYLQCLFAKLHDLIEDHLKAT